MQRLTGAKQLRLTRPWIPNINFKVSLRRRIRHSTTGRVTTTPVITPCAATDVGHAPNRLSTPVKPRGIGWVRSLPGKEFWLLMLLSALCPCVYQHTCPQMSHRISISEHSISHPASLSMPSVQPVIQRNTIQPPVLYLAACVGTAMVASSTVTKWRRHVTICEAEAEMTEDDLSYVNLDPNPANPVIFALGIASAMMQTLSPTKHMPPSTHTPPTPPPHHTALPIDEDISDKEYQALTEVLKLTETSSKIDQSRLDPIRHLFKLDPKDDQSEPFRQFVQQLERKAVSDVSGIRRLIDWVNQTGSSKYDCMTDLAAFPPPPLTNTPLRKASPPPDSKFDFFSVLFKGKWVVPLKERLTYWDPVSLIYMLIDGPVNIQYKKSRIITKLGEFDDGYSQYDPLQSIDSISPMKRGQKYDPMEAFLHGKWQAAKKSYTPTPSFPNDAAAVPPPAQIHKVSDTVCNQSPLLSDKDLSTTDTPTGDPKEKSWPTEDPADLGRHPDKGVNWTGGVSPCLDFNPCKAGDEDQKIEQIETRFETTISLMHDAKDFLRSDVRTGVGAPNHKSRKESQSNGCGVSVAETSSAANRMQDTLSQIQTELTQLGQEVHRLYE